MAKFVKCRSFLVLMVLSFSVLSSATAKANNYCEEPWSELVAKTERFIGSQIDKRKALLFAGPDGRTFNCLDQTLSAHFLLEQQFWNMAVSKVIATDPFGEARPANNFCNASYSAASGIDVMTIHLPYDAEELSTKECLVRLKSVAERVSQFLRE